MSGHTLFYPSMKSHRASNTSFHCMGGKIAFPRGHPYFFYIYTERTLGRERNSIEQQGQLQSQTERLGSGPFPPQIYFSRCFHLHFNPITILYSLLPPRTNGELPVVRLKREGSLIKFVSVKIKIKRERLRQLFSFFSVASEAFNNSNKMARGCRQRAQKRGKGSSAEKKRVRRTFPPSPRRIDQGRPDLHWCRE